MYITQYVMGCSQKDREHIARLFLDWVHENWGRPFEPNFMNIERGDYRPATLSRALGHWSREKYFNEFIETVAHAMTGKV